VNDGLRFNSCLFSIFSIFFSNLRSFSPSWRMWNLCDLKNLVKLLILLAFVGTMLGPRFFFVFFFCFILISLNFLVSSWFELYFPSFEVQTCIYALIIMCRSLYISLIVSPPHSAITQYRCPILPLFVSHHHFMVIPLLARVRLLQLYQIFILSVVIADLGVRRRPKRSLICLARKFEFFLSKFRIAP